MTSGSRVRNDASLYNNEGTAVVTPKRRGEVSELAASQAWSNRRRRSQALLRHAHPAGGGGIAARLCSQRRERIGAELGADFEAEATGGSGFINRRPPSPVAAPRARTAGKSASAFWRTSSVSYGASVRTVKSCPWMRKTSSLMASSARRCCPRSRSGRRNCGLPTRLLGFECARR